MKANGIEVCPLTHSAVVERINQGGARTSDLIDVAERAGLRRADGSAQRVADYIITIERRAGRLHMVDGRWESR